MGHSVAAPIHLFAWFRPLLLWHIVVLAVVQGITEFLPISSSGHLILAPAVLGLADQGVWFDIAVHIGSLGAVVLCFWRDVLTLLIGVADTLRGRATRARQLLWHVAIATIPVVLAGLALVKLGLLEHLRSPLVIAATSILFGLLLWWVDVRWPREWKLEQMSWRGALAVGFAQVLSLIPGTSRSGITITAGRWLALDRVEAARFSMLLSLPTILAAGLLEALELAGGEVAAGVLDDLAIAAAMAFVAALASIHLMLRWVAHASFTPFVIYRVALGLVLIVAVFAGVLPA